MAGVTLAIGGVLLAVRPSRRSRGAAVRAGISALFAAGAALGFGALFVVGVSFAAKHSAPWAVFAVRAGGCGVIVAATLLADRAFAPRPARRAWMATVGTLDVLGSRLYAVATTLGRVSLVAVGASLYPAVTVMLATRVREHLGSSQRAGVALTVLGIGAIATWARDRTAGWQD